MEEQIFVLYCRHNKLNDFSAIKRGKIEFCELTVVFYGEMTYFVNDEPYVLRAGDAVFVPQNAFRARLKGKNADYISINFTAEQCPNLNCKTADFADAEIRYLALALDEEQKRPQKNATVLSAVTEILLIKLAEKQNSRETDKNSRRIAEFLKQNINRQITLDEVGKALYLSPIYCASLFKKQTGETIIGYFNRLKTEEAKQRILQGENNFGQIAESLGFEDYNYFSRVFKKYCGYSPKQFQHKFLHD